jgi:hypothetical protein
MTNSLKKHSAILILCALFSVTNAQNIDFASEQNLRSENLSSKIVADGSPYIDENFAAARITQYKDKIFSARYNAYNNQMEVKIEDDKVIALDKNGDFEVIFIANDKIYRTVNYFTEENTSKKAFLVVLSDNAKYTLFKKERIKFYDKVEAASSYEKAKPAKFQREDDVYYIKKDGKTVYLPQKKKDFLKSFPKQENELKSYLKKEKLNPKNEDELITIVEYLSTLSE